MTKKASFATYGQALKRVKAEMPKTIANGFTLDLIALTVAAIYGRQQYDVKADLIAMSGNAAPAEIKQ